MSNSIPRHPGKTLSNTRRVRLNLEAFILLHYQLSRYNKYEKKIFWEICWEWETWTKSISRSFSLMVRFCNPQKMHFLWNHNHSSMKYIPVSDYCGQQTFLSSHYHSLVIVLALSTDKEIKYNKWVRVYEQYNSNSVWSKNIMFS